MEGGKEKETVDIISTLKPIIYLKSLELALERPMSIIGGQMRCHDSLSEQGG